MSVPFAADNFVPLGPFLRCAANGGRIERTAPPSMSHLNLDFGSIMYSRLPSVTRDAVEFIFGAPLARFPLL